MLHLPAGYLGQQNLAVQAYSTYCIGAGRSEPLPDGIVFDDLFRPDFWVHHTGPRGLKTGDIVRVRARDGSFDCHLCVAATPKGGIIMEIWPKYPTGADAAALKAAAETAESARPRVVPFLPNGKVAVRVEHTTATKWRVIAINQAEHSRDHDTKEQAEKAMYAYLDELRMVLPSAEEIAEKAAAATKADADRKTKARMDQASRTVRA